MKFRQQKEKFFYEHILKFSLKVGEHTKKNKNKNGGFLHNCWRRNVLSCFMFEMFVSGGTANILNNGDRVKSLIFYFLYHDCIVSYVHFHCIHRLEQMVKA